jgi:hypothetical protein
MIEARLLEQLALQKACALLTEAHYAIALVGAQESESVEFHCANTASSRFRERRDVTQESVSLPMRTLDDILASSPLELNSPLFPNLDPQGGELDALRGGIKTLADAEVVQIEVRLLSY